MLPSFGRALGRGYKALEDIDDDVMTLGSPR